MKKLKKNVSKEKMLEMLTECLSEMIEQSDVDTIDAQIQILTGKKQVSDFNEETHRVKKAAKIAEDWMNGKLYDDAMFAA